MWDWKFEGFVKLSSDKTIDATFFRMPDGKWRAWYKDETRNAAIMTAESDDLFHWTLNDTPVIDQSRQEGPKVFRFGGYYWMLTDEWHGMRVYRSKDGRSRE